MKAQNLIKHDLSNAIYIDASMLMLIKHVNEEEEKSETSCNWVNNEIP